VDVILSTSRLTLRPQGRGDIQAIITGLNDWEVCRNLTVVPFPYTLADAEAWIGLQVPPVPGHAVFAIELPGSGMIGAVTLVNELGYWLDRHHHGNGYVTEAAEALLDWHFSARPDDVVPSGIHAGNTASWRVQCKLGFVETGYRDMRLSRSQGREVEHIATSVTRRPFEAARALRRQ
jgi:RimJ/RimL family protein N-acetyltransferase